MGAYIQTQTQFYDMCTFDEVVSNCIWNIWCNSKTLLKNLWCEDILHFLIMSLIRSVRFYIEPFVVLFFCHEKLISQNRSHNSPNGRANDRKEKEWRKKRQKHEENESINWLSHCIHCANVFPYRFYYRCFYFVTFSQHTSQLAS